MPYRKLPDREYLLETYRYNPDTGEVFWRIPHGRWGEFPAGAKATVRGKNCWIMKIRGSLYVASRIVWLMAHGRDPGNHEVWHIDGRWRNMKLQNLALNQRLR
jgi:hypothetical protein